MYSFWHFDDFSWGNTRLAVGEDQKHEVKAEVEYFDPASVPLMTWTDYDRANRDDSSVGTRFKGYPESIPPDYAESLSGEFAKLLSGMPSDEELLQEIRHILSTTDLMKITKKSVRERLSMLFGVDMSPKKEYIHWAIDSILKGEM
jgi:hypothetical protein